MEIFTTFPELETERLRLRRIVADDAQSWLAVWDHLDVLRYLIDFEHVTTELAEVNEIIQWTDSIFNKQTGIRWAITLKPDDMMIGSCGYHLYSAPNRCAEIGYELHHNYWRRGIMLEAVTEMLRFGFAQMNLHRIEANVTVGNVSSASLLRRLGFTLEGTWRDKVFARGQFYDLWQFGMLENEFK